jgi:hypothetical protein
MRSGNTRRTSPRSCRTRRCCNRPCGLSPAPLPSIARTPRVAPSPEHVALIRAASASATSCAAERIAVRERAASSARTISAAPRSRHASRRPAHSMLAATLAACRAALRRIAACSDPFAACWTSDIGQIWNDDKNRCASWGSEPQVSEWPLRLCHSVSPSLPLFPRTRRCAAARNQAGAHAQPHLRFPRLYSTHCMYGILPVPAAVHRRASLLPHRSSQCLSRFT